MSAAPRFVERTETDIPITFVSRENWDEVQRRAPAARAQFHQGERI